MSGGSHDGTESNGRRRSLTAEDVWRVTHDPMLRWQDVPGGDVLANQLMVNPNDAYLLDVFQHVIHDQTARAVQSQNPFWPNFPPLGALPRLVPGRIPIAALPTGDVLSVSIENVMQHVLVVGPTGGGKTTWLRTLIASVLGAEA